MQNILLTNDWAQDVQTAIFCFLFLLELFL